MTTTTTYNAHILYNVTYIIFIYFHEDTLNRAVTPTHPINRAHLFSAQMRLQHVCGLCIYNVNKMRTTVIFAIPLI